MTLKSLKSYTLVNKIFRKDPSQDLWMSETLSKTTAKIEYLFVYITINYKIFDGFFSNFQLNWLIDKTYLRNPISLKKHKKTYQKQTKNNNKAK